VFCVEVVKKRKGEIDSDEISSALQVSMNFIIQVSVAAVDLIAAAAAFFLLLQLRK